MTLSGGDFFYFVSDPSWDDPPHPKIVVLVTQSREVVYVGCTKDANHVIERCKLIEGPRQQYRTMIKITPVNCPTSHTNTYLNCNDLYSEAEKKIISSAKFSNKGSIPPPLFGAIKVAILNSPNTPGAIRTILASPIKPSV